MFSVRSYRAIETGLPVSFYEPAGCPSRGFHNARREHLTGDATDCASLFSVACLQGEIPAGLASLPSMGMLWNMLGKARTTWDLLWDVFHELCDMNHQLQAVYDSTRRQCRRLDETQKHMLRNIAADNALAFHASNILFDLGDALRDDTSEIDSDTCYYLDEVQASKHDLTLHVKYSLDVITEHEGAEQPPGVLTAQKRIALMGRKAIRFRKGFRERFTEIQTRTAQLFVQFAVTQDWLDCLNRDRLGEIYSPRQRLIMRANVAQVVMGEPRLLNGAIHANYVDSTRPHMACARPMAEITYWRGEEIKGGHGQNHYVAAMLVEKFHLKCVCIFFYRKSYMHA